MMLKQQIASCFVRTVTENITQECLQFNMCLSIKVNHPHLVLAEGEHEGFEWVVTSNGMGFRCGYVRVPQGHPWHSKHYDEISADVHGGLTFGEPDVECHKEREDNAYWFGFDCAHSTDAPDPDLAALLTNKPFSLAWRGEVRTQDYVESECKLLCIQAKAANEQQIFEATAA